MVIPQGTEDSASQSCLACLPTLLVILPAAGMSYAQNLAFLPQVYGIYGAFIPCLVYAALGSSKHLAVGPVAVTSLLLGEPVPPQHDPIFTSLLGECGVRRLVCFQARDCRPSLETLPSTPRAPRTALRRRCSNGSTAPRSRSVTSLAVRSGAMALLGAGCVSDGWLPVYVNVMGLAGGIVASLMAPSVDAAAGLIKSYNLVPLQASTQGLESSGSASSSTTCPHLSSLAS